jgi:hypothetical protein
LISDHEVRVLTPAFFSFFCLRHSHPLPCGTAILCLAAQPSFALRRLSPAPGAQTPSERSACLFHDQQQSRNHSTSPNSQPSSAVSSSRCSCVRSSSQQQPAAASSYSYYQPALLPQHKAPRSTTTSRRSAGVPVLSRSIRTHLGFGAALTSPM